MTGSFEVSGVWMRAAQLLPALLLFIGQAICLGAEAPAERGVLKGRFLYDGQPPKPEPIDVSKEPLCKAHNLVNERLLVDANGGLKNVVVYVVTKDVPTPPSSNKKAAVDAATPPVKEQQAGKKPSASDKKDKDVVSMKMVGCRFEPHVLPFLVPRTLEVRSDDAFSHNAYVPWAPEESPSSPSLSPNGVVRHFHNPCTLPVPVECNIHPWMKAYILPRDNPYFAVSKEDGTFEIKDLPGGRALEFQVWHEVAGNFKRLERKGWTKGVFRYSAKPGENDLGEIKFDPKLFERKATEARK